MSKDELTLPGRKAIEGDEKSLHELREKANPGKEDNIEAQKQLAYYYEEQAKKRGSRYFFGQITYYYDEQGKRKESTYWCRMADYWWRIAEGRSFGDLGDRSYDKWLRKQEFPRESEHYAKRQFSGWLQNNNETGHKETLNI